MSTTASVNRAPKRGEADDPLPEKSPPVRSVSGPIPYIRGDKSVLRMGSMNVATVQLDDSGMHQLLAMLFRYMDDQRSQAHHAPVPLHRLSSREMNEQAAAALVATCDLAGPVASVDEVIHRRRQLDALLTGLPSAHREQITAAAKRAVEERFAQIAESLDNASQGDPSALSESLSVITDYLDRLVCPAPSAEGAGRLARLAALLVAVDSGDLPAGKRETLTRLTLAQAPSVFARVLGDLVSVEVAKAIEEQSQKLRTKVRELGRLATACRRHVDGVHEILAAEVGRAAERAAGAVVDNVIVLPGPTLSQCRVQLVESFGCPAEKVINRLLTAYDEQLAMLDAVRGSGLSAGQALSVVPPEQGVEALRRLIFPRLAGQSIYDAIERYGVARLIDTLAELSEPMVHLCRTSSVNNIEPAYRTTLIVPPVAPGTDEVRVLAELRQEAERAIGQRGADMIAVEEREDSGQACHLTQTVMGYSAATLADNYALAWAYCRSRELNHPAHLFGVLPDSPDGQASEIVVEMFRCLEELEAGGSR